MHNLSYENEFYLHIKGCTRLTLKNEVQDNSEMACWVLEMLGFTKEGEPKDLRKPFSVGTRTSSSIVAECKI